jgi:site-specific recombinase XerD
MKVSAILKGKKDSHGRQKVYIRTNDGNARTFKATNLWLLPEQLKKSKVIGHPKAGEYNKIIRNYLVEKEYKSVNGGNKAFPDADFRQYLLKTLSQWEGERSFATIQQYQTEGEKFLNWAGDIKLSKINVDLLNDYKAYLYREGNNGKPYGGNTIWKSFKDLKRIIGKAHIERIIEHNPFDLFDNVKYKNPPKLYLVKEQVQAIDYYSLNEQVPERIRFVAAWFVLGCYTGLRFSDMQKFNKKDHIKGGRLILYTTKTGEIVSLPLVAQIDNLLSRVQYKGMDLSNQKYNDYLKIVGEATGVGSLNAHKSRHSFAVMCAEKGISPEVTAKLMGVTSIKTVAIYYKITGHRMDDEFNKLFAQ